MSPTRTRPIRQKPRLRPLAVAALTATVTIAGCTAPGHDELEGRAGDRLDAAVTWLPDRAAELMEATGVPGVAVAVVSGGETVYAEGFGIADLDTGAPVDADTVFQLASVSKPVGATVVAHQVGEGVVSWTTPVRETLPWFSLSDPWTAEHVTVGDLYSHASGLPDHAGDDLEWLGFDGRTIMERLREIPLAPFRASYAYTNYGMQAAALAVAAGSGTDWATLSRDVLYRPLGMERTTSRYDEYAAMDNRAVGHSEADGRWRVTPEQFAPDETTAAAGVASSVNDMARWIAMVLAGGESGGARVVDADALRLALTPHNTPAPAGSLDTIPAQYGYGFNIGVQPDGSAQYGHSGAFAQGAATYVGMAPAADLGVVVLTNGFPMGLAESLGAEFLDRAQFGESTRDWWGLYSEAFSDVRAAYGELTGKTPPAGAAPARAFDEYVGTYRNDYLGDAVVEERDGELRLLLGPEPGVVGREWPLTHWDGDTFTFLLGIPELTDDSTSAVVFDPAAGTMTIEYYERNGVGVTHRAPAS